MKRNDEKSKGVEQQLKLLAENKAKGQGHFLKTLELAQGGDADLQLAVALLYEEGRGVKSDSRESARWKFQGMRQKAEAGDFNAQVFVASSYASGIGIAKDIRSAQEWCGRAIDQSNLLSIQVLGNNFASGRDNQSGEFNPILTTNAYLASQCYERLVDRVEKARLIGDERVLAQNIGHVPLVDPEPEDVYAMRRLCEIYKIGGRDLQPDITVSNTWRLRAAERGHYKSMIEIADEFADGDIEVKDLVQAEYWCVKAAETGGRWEKFALAQKYDEGTRIIKNQSAALHWYQVAADEGSADARYALGLIYLEGRGVEQNFAKAIELFESNADTDSSDDVSMKSMVSLGKIYEEGLGVEKDYAKARMWYGEAGETSPGAWPGTIPPDWMDDLPMRQSGEARYRLGLMYLHGRGVERDVAKAVRTLKAASWGYPEAHYMVGLLHLTGEGVEQDEREAMTQFCSAYILRAHFGAVQEMAKLYDKGRPLDRDEGGMSLRIALDFMRGERLPRNEALAVEWFGRVRNTDLPEAQFYLWVLLSEFPGRGATETFAYLERSAKSGYPDARYWLARMLIWGEQIPKDEARAVALLKGLDDHGKALWILAWCYGNGVGVPQDRDQEFICLQKSSELGDANSMGQLGDRYFFGTDGCERDLTRGIKFYSAAASSGSVTAHYRMGNICFDGDGRSVDKGLAARYFEFAAERGDAFAQNNLAYLYEKGEGVRQDLRLCCYWLKKSADQGFADAQNGLGEMLLEGRGVEVDLVVAREWFEKAAAQNCDAAIKNLEKFR